MSGYNGWTNYGTWVVALWIDNDEGSYRERLALAEDFTAPEDADEWSTDDRWHVEHTPEDCPGRECGSECDHKERTNDVHGYADVLREWVERDMMPDLGASLASDLLTAALREVNWHEIAEHWLSE